MTRIHHDLATSIASAALGTSAFDRPAEDADLERQRQRADRPLRRAAGRRSRRSSDLVVDRAAAAELASSSPTRGYLPKGVPLLKRVLALPGQTVCRDGLDILAYGASVGRARDP